MNMKELLHIEYMYFRYSETTMITSLNFKGNYYYLVAFILNEKNNNCKEETYSLQETFSTRYCCLI